MTNTAAKFWAKAHGAADECWPYGGDGYREGYRTVRWGAGSTYAHRLAWILAVGPIPDGLFVCHRCDNPPCANPAHLFLGTQKENLADMYAKGRGPRSKLTAAEVLAIRDRVATLSQRAVAREFGICQTTVSGIVTGRIWSHVAEDEQVAA
jgi:hypothetical protein